MSIERATVNILVFLLSDTNLLIYTDIYIPNTIHTDTYGNFLFIEFCKLLTYWGRTLQAEERSANGPEVGMYLACFGTAWCMNVAEVK